MDTNAAIRTGLKLSLGGVVPALLVFGLLLTPVTCTCGSSIPHGHFLFQLQHHVHDQDGHESDEADATAEASEHDSGFSHKPHPMMIDECDDGPGETGFTAHFALSNAMEQQDSAVVNSPPASSIAQPSAITQPSMIETPNVQQCDSIYLPSTRTLEGVATSPETPPPKA